MFGHNLYQEQTRCSFVATNCLRYSICTGYTYLGLVLNEHLDYSITAKTVAQNANSALGLLIAKCKIMGGLPCDAFIKLYDSVVYPIINYGAPLWTVPQMSIIIIYNSTWSIVIQ